MKYPTITQEHTIKAAQGFCRFQDLVITAYSSLMLDNPEMGDDLAFQIARRYVMTGTLCAVVGIPKTEHTTLMKNGAWLPLIDAVIHMADQMAAEHPEANLSEQDDG